MGKSINQEIDNLEKLKISKSANRKSTILKSRKAEIEKSANREIDNLEK